MKKLLLSLVTSPLALVSQAGVLTVNNNAGSPGQYTSLQTAIDSASAGDTIYVHGSATSYGNVNVKKRLTFIGTGHNPNKLNNLVSEAGIIQLDTLSGISGASGSRIIGLRVNRVAGYTGNGGTKNIMIQRNYFVTTGSKINVTGKGWTIENNVILASYVNLNNHANLILRNNIFSKSYITGSNQPSVLITNNVFLSNSSSYALSDMSNAILSNNIFAGATPRGTNVNANTFSNNITYQTTNDTIPFGTNGGSGNFVAQNPLFNSVASYAFNYNYDFVLQAGSPGKNAGTDGTDIGTYGGTNPFVDMTGSPAIPQVKSVTILNPMIPVGDSLKVVIKANKQN